MIEISDKAIERSHDHDTHTRDLIVKDAKLAHAYVPNQKYHDTYDASEGFKNGTIFPELYCPYK